MRNVTPSRGKSEKNQKRVNVCVKIMSQIRKIYSLIFGILFGLSVGTIFSHYRTLEIVNKCESMASVQRKSPMEIISLQPNETPDNSQRTLVFVGVMTAQEFLEDRARAVYETWGKSVPGRMAFFSSEGSVAKDLPLVALKGVDDRYPPQKKSFMMLHYMYEHFIDKFEWFARADDDVFMRTDKLEKFLRSVDSSKPQFIGQAGRGNNEEFGLLSLEYDENFCMGGPGIIMSRETLRLVAPHIPTCLKNLYSTHEDVEVGRCVQKFAKIPCTWNYEMQSIFHHNSSGNHAFSGNLKNSEVHNAITLHPVKRPAFMYRLYAYTLGLKGQEYRQKTLLLHRDIAYMIELLQIPKSNRLLAPGVPIFPKNETSSLYLGDHSILGISPKLNKFVPRNRDELIEWDFIAKSIYSNRHTNPKRKVESYLKESLEDVIREIMQNINNFSRQRGRVIEFRELLYGYTRTNPLYGQDLILDLLLVYKKYRGKKMTVPVRRHLYVQRSFTDIQFRELFVPSASLKSVTEAHGPLLAQKFKSMINSGLEKLALSFPDSGYSGCDELQRKTKIVMVLPLFGRYETFLRFLNNFEDICLKPKQNLNVDLLVALFKDDGTSSNSSAMIQIMTYLQNKYPKNGINYIMLTGNFSRGLALDYASRSNYVSDNDILFFIDVDIVFSRTTIERVRRNTIKHQQVYLPIVLSEYDPRRLGERVPPKLPSRGYLEDYQRSFWEYKAHVGGEPFNDRGFFRQFGYGIVSIFRSDVLNSEVNGFNTDIKGWGLEDVRFLEKIIGSNLNQRQKLLDIADGKSSRDSDEVYNLRLLRVPDPSLVHVYHPIVCEKDLEPAQYRMCLGTKANTLGSFRKVEAMVIENQRQILDYVKTANGR